MMKSKDVLLYHLIIFVVIAVAAVSGLYIAYSPGIASGYELLFLLPLCFGLCFFLGLSRPLLTGKSIFLWTFMIFAFVRYVVLPVSMVWQSYYTGYAYAAPDPLSIRKGILLMIYELLVSTIAICLWYRKHLFPTVDYLAQNQRLLKNKSVYLFFILLSGLMLLANPIALNSISFLTDFRRGGGDGSLLTSISVHSAILAKILLYFIFMDILHWRYLKTQKTIYYILSIIVSALNIVIFVGTNRKRVLMHAISTVLALRVTYPKWKKTSSGIIFALVLLLVFQLTVFRFYTNSRNSIFENLAGTLQVYFSGPYNMAIAIEVAEDYSSPVSSFNILYDFGRPFVGVGYFFKRYDSLTSTEYFNRRLSIGGILRSDQIMPISGQGLLHFGMVFAPAYLVLCIYLGLFMERKLRRTENFEKKYILTLFCLMLGQAMGVNLVIIINVLSLEGVMFYFLHYLNNRVSLKKCSNTNSLLR